MLENRFKTNLVHDIEDMFPGCIILHTDPNDIQGIPDLLILYGNTWAALEGKKSENEPYRPNQEWYLKIMNDMSFASMICPENREAVLHDLQFAFSTRGTSRVSKRK